MFQVLFAFIKLSKGAKSLLSALYVISHWVFRSSHYLVLTLHIISILPHTTFLLLSISCILYVGVWQVHEFSDKNRTNERLSPFPKLHSLPSLYVCYLYKSCVMQRKECVFSAMGPGSGLSSTANSQLLTTTPKTKTKAN